MQIANCKIKKKFYWNNNIQSGFTLVYTAIIIFVFSLVLLAALQYAAMEMRVLRSTTNREQAFQIAEAGVDYYQWHLAHFQSDFWDGNASTTPGPYIHPYVDVDTSQTIGTYELTITPPPLGSTVVTVKSVGYTNANPDIKRTVTVKYGIPSLAIYSFLSNEWIWIGPSEHVSGEMHSNGGIRFDGTGNAPISTPMATYTCPTYSGCSPAQTKPGIWGSANAATQTFWQFPPSTLVPNIDFAAMTADLNNLKTAAQADGSPAYLPPSNKYGYSLMFNNNGTVNIYIVKRLLAPPAKAWDVNGNAITNSIDYDPSQLQLLYNQAPLPVHGVFYVEDKVWVEGMLNGKVTVVAAKLPYDSNCRTNINACTAPSIYIANNICYTQCGNNRDTTSVLGLFSQQSIIPTYNAPTNLEIDGAMIAQNGNIQVYQYNNGTNIKNSITVFGSLGSYGLWTWTYVSGNNVVSGFRNTYTNYDANLLYGPPPSFPLSSGGYEQLNWTSD